MREIIDIHSHILYKVDDGADSIETSLELLKMEWEQGAAIVIFTPHFDIGECMPGRDKIQAHYEKLKAETAKILPEMKLYLGNEIMACNDMVEMLDEGRLFTLADTKYVLIEFYPTVQYPVMERYLRDLLNGGYIPIVAHCERYKCLRSPFKGINYNNIGHLIEMGAYMQVNASSIFGQDRKFVTKLIDNDMLHFVASDAHNTRTRSVFWNKCIHQLEKEYSDEYIEWLLIENPQKVLEGKYIN